eukprot:gene8555-996_t
MKRTSRTPVLPASLTGIYCGGKGESASVPAHPCAIVVGPRSRVDGRGLKCSAAALFKFLEVTTQNYKMLGLVDVGKMVYLSTSCDNS